VGEACTKGPRSATNAFGENTRRLAAAARLFTATPVRGSMSYCSECGAELTAANRFCTECGAEVDPEGAAGGDNGGATRRSPEGRTTGRTRATDTSGGFTTGQKVVFVGAAVTVVGAFLPWISVLGASKSGIDADGVFTLVFGLLAAGGTVVRWGKWAKVGVAVLGVLTAGIGLLYIADPLAGTEAASQFARMAVDPGLGLYVTALGGVGILAGPLVDYA
jgi:hypothetical protein